MENQLAVMKLDEVVYGHQTTEPKDSLVTDGSIKREGGLTAVASGSSGTVSGVDAGGKRMLTRQEWVEKNQTAYARILQCIDDEHVRYVLDSTLASVAWKNLHALYQKNNLSSRFYLKQKLFSYKYQAGETMTKHINGLKDIVSSLRRIGVDVSQEDQAMLLLIGLPESYGPLIMGFDSITAEKLTPMVVTERLLAEERRREEAATQQAKSGVESALFSGRSGTTNKPNARPRVLCEQCKMPGHVKANCYEIVGYPEDHPKHTANRQAVTSQSNRGRGGNRRPYHNQSGSNPRNIVLIVQKQKKKDLLFLAS
jgi:hypothetical protein